MNADDRNKVTASQCISKYFLDAWGLDPDAVLETETVNAGTLLTANRLDLACKLYYIDCMEKGVDTAFARELYKAHIEAFSGGALIEPGLTTKNSIQDYFAGFDKLIEDIKNNGFDPTKSLVPVGADGAILDGSHRTAIAIYYDIPLTIVRIPGRTSNYGYAFFREKGMSGEQLDFMAYQFILYSERVYTVCLWPAAYDEKKLSEADRMIRGCASVVYRKEAPLGFRGAVQLMTAFYRHMAWTGTLENGYSGVASKTRVCYKEGAPTIVYVICGAELDGVLALKQRIRDLYAIENSSVHITDTHDEAVEAGRMLLNKNSIGFMNYAEPYRDTAFIKEFVRRAEAGEPCSGCDSTLSLYGIGGYHECGENDEGAALQDPREHFWFRGVKLPSLGFVKAAKARSGDTDCVKMIEEFERRNRSAVKELKERSARTLGSTGKKLSRSFKELCAAIKRRARVLYHGIRYRGSSAGRGELDIPDMQTAFLDFNTTTADYLVMRNWEGFYDDILLEGHNDIDLLCRDGDTRDIIVRLLDAKPLTFDGYHYSFKYRGHEVTLDTRIMGDGYYDRRWQREMLKSKRLHPAGFYVMDHENYYYSLIYHAIYQKKAGLSDEYAERLYRMAPEDGRLTQEQLAEKLDAFMRKHRYAYTQTADRSVVKAFSNTAIPKKLRYPLGVRMRHAAEKLKNKHLLQRLKIKLRNLIIRG